LVFIKNTQPIIRTKGWIIKIIKELLPNLEIIFIDDSIDNIKCVNKIKNDNIHLYYIHKNKNPKKYLIKLLSQL
jgi:hypothetical protein